MDAQTIDTGATVSTLRAFGPPEVLALDDFLGNASATEHVSLFWERIEAVCLELACAAGGAARVARVRMFSGDAVPFVEVLAPFTVAATNTARITFARDVQPAGANNGPSIVTPLPVLTLLPGWSLTVDVLNGAAGDHVTQARLYRTRFELVELAPVLELAETL